MCCGTAFAYTDKIEIHGIVTEVKHPDGWTETRAVQPFHYVLILYFVQIAQNSLFTK
jgi:hypothetical protein